MDRKWEEVAGRMVAWVRELHVRENGMRTDTDVEAVVEGITEGSTLPLSEALGRDGARPSRVRGRARGGLRIPVSVIHEFAERLAGKLYPDGAWTIEGIQWRRARERIRVWFRLHLAAP